MPRQLSSAVAEEIASPWQQACHLLYGDWGEEKLRLNDTMFDIPLDGQVFQASGGLVSLEAIEEAPDAKVSELKVGLNGIGDDVLPFIENYSLTGIPIYVWRAYLNEDGQIIGTPILLFSGYSDGASVSENNEGVSISLTCRDRLSAFTRVRGRRTNHREHQAKYPNDPSFEFIASFVDKNIDWTLR